MGPRVLLDLRETKVSKENLVLKVLLVQREDMGLLEVKGNPVPRVRW